MHSAHHTPGSTGPATRTVRETWARVDAGLYVGNRDGNDLGAVQAVRGGFVAIDGHGTPIGRYTSKNEARHAVRRVAECPNRTRRNAHLTRVARYVATGAGVITVTAALTAFASTPWY